MEASHPLAAQIAALEEQRRGARRAIAVFTELDARLGEWAQGEMSERLVALGMELEELGRPLGDAASVADRWTALARTRASAEELFTECLTLGQGTWAREHLADTELHLLADRFVEELNRRAGLDWDRLTVPAQGELYAELTQAICVPYPSAGLWELPLVAHEYGHFAAERLAHVERPDYQRRRRLLVSEALAEEGRGDDRAWALAGEYFADAFATYAIGPAYPWAYVVLRAQPVETGFDDFEHPPPAERVALMLEVLALMDRDRIGAARFNRARKDIASLWRSARTQAGEADQDPEVLAAARKRAGDLYGLLRKLRATLGYDGFHRAQAVATGLRGRGRSRPLDSAVALADVVNAAWICRQQRTGGDPPAQIEKRARALCLQLDGPAREAA